MRFVVLFLLGLGGCAYGLVQHLNGEPPQTWTDHPADAVSAMVGSCSATVIHPQYIMSVSHCGVSLSTPITVAGQVYYPEAIYTHPTKDIRLIKVLDAHFSKTAVVNDAEPDLEDDSLMTVIGGWGKKRGNTVYSTNNPNKEVGYSWSSQHGHLVWGTSRLRGYSNANLYTKFEHPDDPGGTAYECSLATYDSGCGMYCQTGEDWQLIGIGQKVGDGNISYFRNPADPNETYGTLSIYIRVAPFAGWVHSIIYGADIEEDGWINVVDLEQFCDEWLSSDSTYFYRSDLDRDGRVDLADFTQLAAQWDTVTAPADITGNGQVDVEDLMLLMQQWLHPSSDLACDLDNSGIVDIVDFSLLAKYW